MACARHVADPAPRSAGSIAPRSDRHQCAETPGTAPPPGIKAIERSYFSRSDTAREFLRDLDEHAPTPNKASPRSDDLLQVAEHAPITQLINLILLEAIKASASDIHVEPFESRLRIRFRIDGMLYEQTSPPKHLEPALISRLKVMA